MFFFRNKRRLTEANKEIARLRTQLEETQATVSHLRHIIELKTEEIDELSARIGRMKEKSDYADAIEGKMTEIEEQVDRFSRLKLSMQHKIQRLTMERDEARALIAARDKEQRRDASIDFLSVPVELPPLPAKRDRNMKQDREQLTTEKEESEDWYTSLSEPSIE